MKRFFFLLCLGVSLPVGLSAKLPAKWDFHMGLGIALTASGLPSQMSNQVAFYEDYVDRTENARGLPLGGTLFLGTGYVLPKNSSFGFEYGVGYNVDIGLADVIIGQTVPKYVTDGIKSSGLHPDLIAMALAQANQIYGGMTAKNNEIRGSFVDQKFLAYYKFSPNFKDVPMSFQLGTGLKMIHALSYYAIQSKNPADYIRANGQNLNDGISWNAISIWASKPVNIPFPLRTTDGKIFMHQHQPLMDFSFRWNVSMFYLDIDYATEFRYIHNVKISAGAIFDRNILESFKAKK